MEEASVWNKLIIFIQFSPHLLSFTIALFNATMFEYIAIVAIRVKRNCPPSPHTEDWMSEASFRLPIDHSQSCPVKAIPQEPGLFVSLYLSVSHTRHSSSSCCCRRRRWNVTKLCPLSILHAKKDGYQLEICSLCQQVYRRNGQYFWGEQVPVYFLCIMTLMMILLPNCYIG